MFFPIFSIASGVTALLSTYLFIFLMYRASIDAKKTEIELMNARMRLQAFQDRQDALHAYQDGRRY